MQEDQAYRSAARGAAKKSDLRELVESLVIAVVLALLVRTFFFQPFYIPSGSMEPTLFPGDRIAVNKLGFYFGSPKRGDVIVFRYPLDTTKDYIKRVVALGGESLQVKNDTVLINGVPLAESYLPAGEKYADFGPVTVPDGYFFVMGDNRSNSQDSRFWGPLEKRYVLGKAVVIFWPLGRINTIR